MPGSPAVGVVPIGATLTGTSLNGVQVCPRTDQRGVASLGKCTIGAAEQQGVWPSQVQGYPALPTKGSPPRGFFIGVLSGIWKLYSHNLTGVDHFTGTITTNGTFSGAQLIRTESNDTMTVINNHTISFSFYTGSYVDGVKFVTNGGDTLRFENLKENGTLVPPSDIYLGGPATPATANPVVFTRS